MKFTISLVMSIVLATNVAKSVKVFEFSNKIENNNISTVAIKVPLQDVDNFTICLSHRQYQLNLHTRSLFTLFEDEELTVPWFSASFWFNDEKNETVVWGEFGKFQYFILGSFSTNSFDTWIHTFYSFDFLRRKIVSSVLDVKNSKKSYFENNMGNNFAPLSLLYLR